MSKDINVKERSKLYYIMRASYESLVEDAAAMAQIIAASPEHVRTKLEFRLMLMQGVIDYMGEELKNYE